MGHLQVDQDSNLWKTSNRTSGEQLSSVAPDGKPICGFLKASVVEALQIIYPLRDLATFRLHSELCLVVNCSRSQALKVIALVVAFAWIALWRFLWVYSLRYSLVGLGKLLAGTLRLWDVFSDWFLDIDQQQRAKTRDF